MPESKKNFLLVEPLIAEEHFRRGSCGRKLIPFPFVSLLALGSSCLLLISALCTHVVGQQRLTVQETATSMGIDEGAEQVKHIKVEGLPKKGFGSQELIGFFREYGNVVKAFRRPSFGVVIFSTASEAQAAIEKTNGYQYNNSVFVTSLGRQRERVQNVTRKRGRNTSAPPSARKKKSPSKKQSQIVVVKGLPSDVDKEQFKLDICQKYGTVVSILLRRPSPPWIFVKYSTASEAQAAVEKMNGTEYGDSVLTARLKKRGTWLSERIRVKGLPLDVDKEKLRTGIFQEYGTVVKIWWGRSKSSWTYVQYSTASEAQAAVETMNGTKYGDSVLLTELAVDTAENTVMVGGLPFDFGVASENEKLINNIFQEYGTIVDTSMNSARHWSALLQRCTDEILVTVKYSTASEAQSAVEKMNGTQYGNFVLMTEMHK